ncbi:hypothetical protein PTKIN_Ptkin07bG0280900 [Pterospermum kingtungense]
MPGPKLTLRTLTQQFNERLDSDTSMDSQFGFHKGVDKPATLILLGPNFMASKLYQLSPPKASVSIRCGHDPDWITYRLEIMKNEFEPNCSNILGTGIAMTATNKWSNDHL